MTPPNQTTLLLVEDDEGHATLIAMNLRDAGLTNTIEHITDGQTALDHVAQLVEKEMPLPLVILLDLNLPVLDGYGVLAKLKADARTRKIPVIIFSSSDDEREIARCYALGCNAFLQKPIEYNNLILTIRQLGSFLSVVKFPSIP